MQDVNLGPHLVALTAAAGATRMVAADDGAWVVAELGGRWLSEAFTEYQEAPPVLKLIDPRRDAVVATASGWILGRPDKAGALYLTTDGAELTYRLSWLVPPGAKSREPRALTPPPGIWAVKASFPVAENRAAAILWRPSSQAPWRDHAARREELWLATIDAATGSVLSQATWTGLTPRVGARTVQSGVAGGPGAIYLIDQAGGGSKLVAFDAATLAMRWSTKLAPPKPVAGDGATLAPSGDGVHIMVVLGESRDSGVLAEAGFLVAAATGEVTAVLDSARLGAATRVEGMTPGKGGNIVWPAVLDTRGQSTNRLSLAAIAAVDASTAQVTQLLDTAEPGRQPVRDAVPVALALDPASGGHWVALPFRDGAMGTGRDRGEVAGLVETPGGWYQPGRPRIDEWLANQR